MGSTSLLSIYATAADFLYRLSAAGKVVMMWTYMDCILKEKRKWGKAVWISKKKFRALESRVSELEKAIKKAQSQKKSPEELINIVKEEFYTKPGTYSFCAKIRNHVLFDGMMER